MALQESQSQIIESSLTGVVTASTLSGIINYEKLKRGETTKEEMLREGAKFALQGGIAAVSVAQTKQFYAQKNLLGATLSVAAGIVGVYAVEKVAQKLQEKPEEIGENDAK